MHPHHALLQPPHALVARQATMVTVTSTAGLPTVTVTSTAGLPTGPTPTSAAPSLPSGSRTSAIVFIFLISLVIALLLGILIYRCVTGKGSKDADEAAPENSAGNELQPSAPAEQGNVSGNRDAIQSAPEREVYGYFAPTGQSVAGNGKGEEEVAAREVYGYFSPTVAPRVGDGVVARPGA